MRRPVLFWRLLAFFVGVLIISFSAYAFPAIGATGPPQLITYMGRLTDSNGDVLGGSGTTYYFRFAIYDASSGGTKLWPSGTPCSHAITVRSGVFTANIGDTSSCADVLNFNFDDNDAVYLQVEVSPDNSTWETLTPRQRITSAGYALNASTTQGALPGAGANNLLKLDASGNIDITGDIITTGNATSSIFHATTLGVGNEYITDVTGSGLTITNGALSVSTGVDSLSNYDWTFDTTYGTKNLTASTTIPLWVKGALNASSTARIEGALTLGGNITFMQTSTSTVAFSGNTGINFDSDTFVIDPVSNNVGIGTSTPTSALTVNPLGFNAAIRLVSDSASRLAAYQLGRNGSVESQWAAVHSAGNFSNFSTQGDTVLRASTEDLILSARNGSGAIRFGTGATDTEKLTLTNAGLLGIATTTPAKLLSVHGNGLFSGDLSVAGLNATGTVNFTGAAATTTIAGGLVVDTKSLVVDYSSGNVGIGTASPTAKLEIDSDSNTQALRIFGADAPNEIADIYMDSFNALVLKSQNGWVDISPAATNHGLILRDYTGATTEFSGLRHVDNGASDRLEFAVDSTDYGSGLVLLQNNTVGIGTTTPAKLLSVHGNGLFSGDLSVAGLNATGTVNFTGAAATTTIAGGLVVDTKSLVVDYSSGNVGIGTTSPATLLHITEESNSTLPSLSQETLLLLQRSSCSLCSVRLSLIGSGIGNETIAFGDGGDEDAGWVQYNTNFPNSESLKFGVENAERMRIMVQGTGIATTTPWGRFSVEHTSSDDPVFVVGDQGSTSPSFIVDGTGKVGVRTANPQANLHVDGNTGLLYETSPLPTLSSNTKLLISNTNPLSPTAAMSILSNSASNSSINFGDQNDEVSGRILYDNSDDSLSVRVNAAEALHIDSSQNIGIGTTTPWGRFSVEQTSSDDPVFVVSDQGTSTPSFWVDGTGNVGIGNADPTEALDIGDGNLKFNTYARQIKYKGILASSVSAIQFGAVENGALRNGLVLGNGVNDLYINQSGNVGVATSSAWGLLSVEQGASSDPVFVVGDQGTSTPSFWVDGTGNVGIGTDDPLTKLHVVKEVGGLPSVSANTVAVFSRTGVLNTAQVSIIGAGSAFSILNFGDQNDEDPGRLVYDHTLDAFNFKTAASANSSLFLDSSQRVGIATTSPVSTLSVQGSLCVRDTGSCGTGAGEIYTTGGNVASIDVAENYPTKDESIEAGDIVSLSRETLSYTSPTASTTHSKGSGQATETIGTLIKAREGQGEALLGVISTKPGLLFGYDIQEVPVRPVTLVGRVPVKVNDEGGAITIGDRIAPSSAAGVGRKAEEGDASIGIALEPFDGAGEELIMVFVNLAYAGVDVAQLASSTPQYTDSGLLSAVRDAFVSLGIKIVDGVVHIKDLVVARLTTGELTVRSDDVSQTGITIYDRATGEPTCVYVEGGALTHSAGACGASSVSSSSSSAPPPTASAGPQTSSGTDDAGDSEQEEGQSTTTPSTLLDASDIQTDSTGSPQAASSTAPTDSGEEEEQSTDVVDNGAPETEESAENTDTSAGSTSVSVTSSTDSIDSPRQDSGQAPSDSTGSTQDTTAKTEVESPEPGPDPNPPPADEQSSSSDTGTEPESSQETTTENNVDPAPSTGSGQADDA